MNLQEFKKEVKRQGYKVKTKNLNMNGTNFLSVNIYTLDNKLVTKDMYTQDELVMYRDILEVFSQYKEEAKNVK